MAKRRPLETGAFFLFYGSKGNYITKDLSAFWPRDQEKSAGRFFLT